MAAGAERAWVPLVSLEDERLLAHSPGVELLDQLGQPVDTRGESFNAVIIIEYDLPGGSKVAGSFT